ncbi:COP1-interactive protein 1-like [Pyrus communis]|uniref:COP1-interactive protein 1-like n=1 Tax=Pyrus communis TaxID=23211 RepID=UPI0035C0B302
MGSVSHPPYFDGDNYAAWKAKMKSFLWALDDRVWLAVEEGWEPPTVSETKGEGQSSVTISMLKPRRQWSEDERIISTFNQRALNALFTAVSPEQFNYISKCTTAKEAWDILEVTYEGNSTVKESKLQNLIMQFENIKMLDDESFSDFYAKLSVSCENDSYRRIERFSTYKLEQLIGSLQTYESDFTEVKKGKNVAFKVNNEKVNEDSFQNLTQDEFALLTKQARKFLKLRSSRGRENRNNFDSNSKVPRSRDVSHGNSSKFVKLGEKKSSNDRDKCFECQGYGHHAYECANTLKKLNYEKNKALTSTWSDNDSEKDTASEDDDEVVTFVGILDGYEIDDSVVEEPDSVEVLQKYTALYDITMKVKKENDELKNKLVQLESKKNEVEIEHQSQMKHAGKLRESMLEKLHMLASDNEILENELRGMKKKVEEFSQEKLTKC